jgi:aspartyl-tRNA(Asn)/glutamyl-tRNA(Gln) amidotransferase subunit A
MKNVLSRVRDDRLGCFWWIDEEGVAEGAARVDRLVAEGADAGPLAGVPVAVKDCFDVEGLPTTGGVRLEDPPVAARDAEAIDLLRSAGALILGKSAMHQLAWGMSGQAPGFPLCRNPVEPERMPGGSSSGSAASLGGSLVGIALGTDSGGSVRVPAAWCGVVGFKPTLGSLPLGGCLPMAPSLDTCGVLGGSVEDIRVVFAVLTQELPERSLARRPLRIAVVEDAFDVDAEVAAVCRRALAAWAREGAILVPTRLDWPRRLLGPVYAAEFAAEWGAAVDGSPALFSEEVRAGVASGRDVSPAEYSTAQRRIESLRVEFAQSFADVDAIALPTVPILPPSLDAPDPVVVAGRNTRPFNGLGWPALSLPCGFAGELPVGIQLAAPAGHDLELLAAAAELESILSLAAA